MGEVTESGLRATRAERRALASDNRKYPKHLVQVPRPEWPSLPSGLSEVWRSRDFLVQVYLHESAVRISVCRTEIIGERWREEISWDDLQRLKDECGRGDQCAVEVYPPNDDVVNVANMRHLWITTIPAFMWRKAPSHD